MSVLLKPKDKYFIIIIIIIIIIIFISLLKQKDPKIAYITVIIEHRIKRKNT